MKDKKFQIFVSSTFVDLIEERQAAVGAILSSGNIPAGMELFTAGDESQMTVIKRWIDESDVYLLILGGRYGSIEKKSGKSYTHLEYEYALSINKPLFTVVLSDKALNDKFKTMGLTATEQENPKNLAEFKSIVLNSIIIKRCDDLKDIQLAIHQTLSEFSYSKDLVGWIRGNNSVNTGLLAEQIAQLTKENADLRHRLSNSESNSLALYSGLTYSELEDLLRRNLIEDVDFKRDDKNLFDYVLTIGEELSKGYNYSDREYRTLNRLVMFKLAYHDVHYDINPSFALFKFTESGHNFYLKALLLASK
jgi:Domain of unknown function (DUF4062)